MHGEVSSIPWGFWRIGCVGGWGMVKEFKSASIDGFLHLMLFFLILLTKGWTWMLGSLLLLIRRWGGGILSLFRNFFPQMRLLGSVELSLVLSVLLTHCFGKVLLMVSSLFGVHITWSKNFKHKTEESVLLPGERKTFGEKYGGLRPQRW
jgi:hypothetical protein